MLVFPYKNVSPIHSYFHSQTKNVSIVDPKDAHICTNGLIDVHYVCRHSHHIVQVQVNKNLSTYFQLHQPLLKISYP